MGEGYEGIDSAARVGTHAPEQAEEVLALASETEVVRVPRLIADAWTAYGDKRTIVSAEEASANVSTNQVFRLRLSDGGSVIAKTSSYASYFLFREDHDRIHLWNKLLQRTRYKDFLADALSDGDRVFTYLDGKAWAVFYKDADFQQSLPRLLSEDQIVNLAEEIAYFHKEGRIVAGAMPLTSVSIKSDIIHLYDGLCSPRAAQSFRMSAEHIALLQRACFSFLTSLDALGYDYWQRLPLLIDWNIGNFSVKYRGERFKLHSRWDYDWFRMEPPTLDFYFLSRVVSEVGDRSDFSYLPDCLLEPRFRLFLRAYHSINPLTEADLLFLKEVYRFFILNYVIRKGEHFFRPHFIKRLKREALTVYLQRLDDLDFSALFSVLTEDA